MVLPFKSFRKREKNSKEIHKNKLDVRANVFNAIRIKKGLHGANTAADLIHLKNIQRKLLNLNINEMIS